MKLFSYWPLSLYQSILLPISAYATYYIDWQLTTGSSRRRYIAEHGCKPARK